MISVFKGGRMGSASSEMSIDDFLNGIKYGTWKDAINNLRQEQNEDKRKRIKRGLPSVTVSGTFIERKADLLVQHSGYLCVDIDHFNDKTALLNDPYTYSLFRSASGNGIAVIVKINKEKHRESFNWIANYYFNNYGISVDRAPSSPASLRFVSYDNELIVNSKSYKAKTKMVKKYRKPRTLSAVYDGGDVANMVRECVNSGQNIAPNYDEYLKLGFAIAQGFGEDGRGWFHDLCSVSEKYNSGQCDKQYSICLKGKGSGVNVGTFYWMLKQAGVTMPKGNDKAVMVAAMAKKKGRTVEGTTQHLVEIEGVDGKRAELIAKEVFNREDVDLSEIAKDPDKLIESLFGWLKMNHDIQVNCITRKLEEKGSEVTTGRLNSIYLRARMAFRSEKVNFDIIQRIAYSDMIAEFNPITHFIDKNRHRNTTGNIEKMVKSIKTDTQCADTFIIKWLVSIIAAYDGNVIRLVLALVGGQMTGKTEWFRRLLPSALYPYYAESNLDSGKDDELLMTQKLVIMDDEMGGKSKQDAKRFKELTSKQMFSLRPPYGRHNEDFKRLCILCGTSNDPNVINDQTGNTRILPVNVISIDHDLYNSIDKSELFMECVRAYEGGFEWNLTKSEIVDLAKTGKEFESIAFERELIESIFAPVDERVGDIEYLTSVEIKNVLETQTNQKIMNLARFRFELGSIFGKSFPKKIDGILRRVYQVIKISDSASKSQAVENETFKF